MKKSGPMRNPVSSYASGGGLAPAGAQGSRPWYREPWPWILMAGPAAVVIAGFVTLWLAISSDDGLVTEDYYKQGLAISRVLDRDARADSLGLKAKGRAEGGAIRLALSARKGTALPQALTLRIVYPARAGKDQSIRLRATGEGRYEGSYFPLAPARWLLVLEDPGKTWRITGTLAWPGPGDFSLAPERGQGP